MPVSITFDAVGSTYTRGVSSSLLDAARRVVYVEGLDGDSGDSSQAASEVIASAGIYHHQDTTLPLQRIQVRKYGPDRARLVMVYGRRRINRLTSSSLITKFRSGRMMSRMWYNRPDTFTDGRPSGLVKFQHGDKNDQFAIPMPWIWRTPSLQIFSPTVLAFQPIPFVINKLEKINSDAVAFGNHPFPAGTLRFDGIDVDHIVRNEVDMWETWYAFTASPGGFVEQSVDWNGTEHVATTFTNYQTTTFANEFPYSVP